MNGPKETEGMSLNEQVYVAACENLGPHPLKYANDWEKRDEDFEDEEDPDDEANLFI